MLLFLPIRTDAPVQRKPYVNIGIIAANVILFAVTDLIGGSAVFESRFGDQIKDSLGLYAARPELYQVITYQFLHGGVFHLFGNMLFLWVFGNSINSKMGNPGYLLFYLACGVFAGVGYALDNHNPLIGASGSIAGVTTAYLVLHPRSQVTMFYWLWLFIGTMPIQALILIGVKVILYDNMIMPRISGPGNVAVSAHLYGYGFGFLLSLLLLAIRALPRDQFDIVALWKRAYQRSQMRTAMADPDARAKATLGRVARPVSVQTGQPIEDMATAVPAEMLDEVTRLRVEIAERLSDNDYLAAAQKYEELVSKHADQCLPRKQMIDVANQLMSMQRYPQAASAYEKFLKHYSTAPDAQQVRLLLGIIYARYLQQYEPAKRHLEEILGRLTNDQQRQQAMQWLDVARDALGGAGPSTA